MCVSKRLRLLYPGFIVVFVVLVVVLLGVVVLIVVIIIIIVVVMFSDLLSILVGMVAVFLVLLLHCSQSSHAVPLPCAPPPPPPRTLLLGGLNVVIVGRLSKSQAKLAESVTKLGGKVVSKATEEVDICISKKGNQLCISYV